MEASELRIANIVGRGYMNPSTKGLKKEYSACEVKSIGIEKVIVSEKLGRNGLIKMDFENLKPIEITDFWLLKLGFEKNRFNPDMFEICGYCFIYLIQDGFCRIDFSDGRSLPISAKYVHHLQNLFYMLSLGNKELIYVK